MVHEDVEFRAVFLHLKSDLEDVPGREAKVNQVPDDVGRRRIEEHVARVNEAAVDPSNVRTLDVRHLVLRVTDLRDQLVDDGLVLDFDETQEIWAQATVHFLDDRGDVLDLEVE